MKLSTIMKKGIAIGVVGAMVAGLAACGGNDANNNANNTSANNEANNSGSGTTIQFQQWWGVELPEGYLEDIVAQYKEDTGVTVELLSAPWADTKTAITSGATNGTIADNAIPIKFGPSGLTNPRRPMIPIPA